MSCTSVLHFKIFYAANSAFHKYLFKSHKGHIINQVDHFSVCNHLTTMGTIALSKNNEKENL